MRTGTGDEEYLAMLDKGLHTAFREFTPDIILYNAGTDILIGDPLGRQGTIPSCLIEIHLAYVHFPQLQSHRTISW